jgi:hypothetical protein
MSERDSQIQREFEIGVDEPATSEQTTEESQSRLESLVSPTVVVVAVVLSILGTILIGSVPLLGFAGELLGVAVAGCLYGLVADSRHYLELALAGALVGGGFSLLSNLVLTLLGAGIPLVAVGVLGGAVAGVVGHYLGRDLRDGLTREL